MKVISPPKIARRFLQWFCPDELLEGIEGDLIETFEHDLRHRSQRTARLNYCKNVLRFFRPAILLRNRFVLKMFTRDMIRSYFTISLRYLAKNRTFSAINIVGLAFGMAAALLIYAFAAFENSFDDFHKNAAQVYRVTTEWNKAATPDDRRATTMAWSGPGVKDAFPEVLDYARFTSIDIFTGANTVTYDKLKINEQQIFLADPSFFRIFSFQFLTGDPATALADPGNIVITESIAEKYFKAEDPIGKLLHVDTHGNVSQRGSDLYKVSAVVKDPPVNSHITFDFLLSFDLIFEGLHDGSTYWHWDYTYCYLLLHPDTDVAELEKKMSALRVKQFGKDMEYFSDAVDFKLQPLEEIHLHSALRGELSANGDGRTLYFLMVIGVCILSCAYINYINLSTVKAVERRTEIGIRKVVGSTKAQLTAQLLVEALVLHAAAFLLALAIFRVSTPFLESIFEINWPAFNWRILNAPFLMIAGATFAAGIILSVVYPAFVLARLKPAMILKGNPFTGGQKSGLRYVLIVLQFIFCITFATGTYALFSQQQFMRRHDLGMNIDHLLAVKGYGFQPYSVYENFRDQLASSPYIESVGTATAAPGEEIVELSLNPTISITGSSGKSQRVKLILADDQFFNTLGVNLAAGRGFSEVEKNVVMLNQAAAKLLGWQESDIVGQTLTGIAEVDPQIVGVVRNYNQRSLKNNFEPIIFLPMKGNEFSWSKRYFFVRFANRDGMEHLPAHVAAVESAWKKSNPEKPFQHFFVDNYFDHQYKSDDTATSLFVFFSSFTVFIACLGLFGIVAYTTLQRTKEIGVRKILGASIPDILALLSRDFLKLISIAAIISLPVVVIALRIWLQEYAFRIPVTAQLLLFPLAGIFTLAMVTVIFRSRKVAGGNPVDNLRYE